MFLNINIKTVNNPQKKEDAMEKRNIVCSAVLLLSMSPAFAGLTSVIEHRSQSSNNARKVAGEFGYVHLRDQDTWYTRSASTAEYKRSFNPHNLAKALFGCFVDDCDRILIQGKDVENRDENALLADYFYLPSDYSSVVTVKPVISEIIFDYNLYVGFNFKCIKDAYFRVYAPLVRSKWILNMEECPVDNGTAPYPAGYFMPCEMPREAMNTDFCAYMRGESPERQCALIMNPGLNDEPDALDIGDELANTVFHGLSYYNANCCGSLTETTIADLRMELGWNFWNYERYHLGVNAQAAFPTGTRPNARAMFNPVVGNGKHWEFGGGVTGHYIFWQCGDMEKSFGINLDANLTYLFENREQRTFDLQGKCLSRFMLAAREGAQVAPIGAIAGSENGGETFTTPCGQFKYEYAPVANLTTLDVRVKSSLQADIALWLNYTNRNLSVDLGYNFWGRAHDEGRAVQTCDDCPTICDPEFRDVWVLKGEAQMYGFIRNNREGENVCLLNAIPLSPSESGATITSGAIPPLLGESPLDNAQLAWGNLRGDELNRTELFDAPFDGEQVLTSVDPVYINCGDIDFCARNKGISNKIWTNIQYTWDLDRDCNPLRCKPFLGLGGEVEFGVVGSSDDCYDCCSTSSSCCPSSSSCFNPCSSSTSCGPCVDAHYPKVAASQWGIWLKGGMNFE